MTAPPRIHPKRRGSTRLEREHDTNRTTAPTKFAPHLIVRRIRPGLCAGLSRRDRQPFDHELAGATCDSTPATSPPRDPGAGETGGLASRAAMLPGRGSRDEHLAGFGELGDGDAHPRHKPGLGHEVAPFRAVRLRASPEGEVDRGVRRFMTEDLFAQGGDAFFLDEPRRDRDLVSLRAVASERAAKSRARPERDRIGQPRHPPERAPFDRTRVERPTLLCVSQLHGLDSTCPRRKAPDATRVSHHAIDHVHGERNGNVPRATVSSRCCGHCSARNRRCAAAASARLTRLVGPSFSQNKQSCSSARHPTA